jgi:2-oxoglutarate dehydrogenase E1 component
VLGVLVHGDAAFAGQGLVAETLNLSQLKGYRTGGTVHVIVNNQIGFTTAPSEGRSTPDCTDIAKMIQVPIFHVNGDDPEAVAHVARLAMDYRREFASDVVIDLFCFRRYGHNEGDEPSFTQPLLYKKIDAHPPLPQLYAKRLVAEGVIDDKHLDRLLEKYAASLEAAFTKARATVARPRIEALGGAWVGYWGGLDGDVPDVDTGVPRERLEAIAERMSTVPEGFHPHPKIARLLEQRHKMGRGEQPLDWGMGEGLAMGSLAWEGRNVRVSGQDSRRGTFSHRHAVLLDVENGSEYTPLEHLHDKQGNFRIYDSPLSEAAVLGFEFGYSLDYPDGLVVWEAQFGDFVNGAQVILDQFISSSEDKWRRLSGVTLFLPHGYEGQGPEHSSARFERFLQLAAEDNMQVCQPTTPAQMFHLLRRQVARKLRKPLIVLTPKSLLRLPAARSRLDELTHGGFRCLLDDDEAGDPKKVERVLLCTGKVYYDLVEERKRRQAEGKPAARVAIVRVEQLYPLRADELRAMLDRYAPASELAWVQDEPANMGAQWFMLGPRSPLAEYARAAGRRLHAVSRVESASPATGSHKAHQIEQGQLLEQALAPLGA